MYMLLAGQEDIPNHQLKLVREESVGGAEAPLYALAKRASGDDSKLSVLRSDIEMDGDRGPIEFELNTVIREYRISWERRLADLSELAKLRWGRGWTERSIAERLGLSYNSVHMRLRGLVERNGCYDRLDASVKKLVP